MRSLGLVAMHKPRLTGVVPPKSMKGTADEQHMIPQQPVRRWPAYRLLGLASGLLTAIGFVGLWLCKLIREHQGITERQFMETTSGGVAVWSLSACFILGLLVLFPISLYLQKRAGVPLPGPNVPDWIAWPLRVVMILGVGLLLLILVGIAMSSLFRR